MTTKLLKHKNDENRTEKKYEIVDWAGNDKTAYYGLFDSFEDAWARLYEEFDRLPEKEFDEQMGEFKVIEIKF
jgi:hypothetical protein